MKMDPRALAVALLASLAWVSACGEPPQSSNTGTPSGALVSFDDVPIVIEGGLEALPSVFLSVQGDQFDPSEFPGASPERVMQTLGILEDSTGQEWRRAYGELTLSDFFHSFVVGRLLELSPAIDIRTYENPRCGDRCTLQIWASPTIEFEDVNMSELSWESRPEEWYFAQIEIDQNMRRRMTGLREDDVSTGRVVATVGTLWLSHDGDRLVAELRETTLEGNDRRRTADTSTPDAGFERTSQERQ